jgi:hypothetical protein
MEERAVVTIEDMIRSGVLDHKARRRINWIALRFGLVTALGVAVAVIAPRFFIAEYPVHWEDAVGWALAGCAAGFSLRRATLLPRVRRISGDVKGRHGID